MDECILGVCMKRFGWMERFEWIDGWICLTGWLAGWLAGIRMGGDKDKGEYGWVDKMAGAGRLNAQMNSAKISVPISAPNISVPIVPYQLA